MKQYELIEYWDPIRGLTLARVTCKDKKCKINDIRTVERLTMPLFTIPPESLTLPIESELALIAQPMPLGKVPLPQFEALLLNIVHGLARLRWEKPREASGVLYELYKIASSNSGVIQLDYIIDKLLSYLSKVWAYISCSSLIAALERAQETSSESRRLIDIYDSACIEEFFKYFSGKYDVNGYSIIINSIKNNNSSQSLLYKLLLLRDLFLFSIFLGKINYIIENESKDTPFLVHVTSKQAALEKYFEGDCNREPFGAVFDILFGDPTGLAIIPFITAISRVYGGGLWARIPRLYYPYLIKSNCKRLNLLEIIANSYTSPQGYEPAHEFHGIVESSLLMEALDVYSSSLVFEPWTRAAVATIFTRYFMGAIKKLKKKHKNKLKTLLQPKGLDNNILLIPLAELENETIKAIVFRYQMPTIVVEDLGDIASRIIESEEEIGIDFVKRSVRSHIETVSLHTLRTISRVYNHYIDILQDISSDVKCCRLQGIAYEVLNPIIDLIPNPTGLSRLISIRPFHRRRLLRNILDRLTDSEYTRIFIYYIIELDKRQSKKKEVNIASCWSPSAALANILQITLKKYNKNYSSYATVHTAQCSYRRLTRKIYDILEKLYDLTFDIKYNIGLTEIEYY